MKFLSVLLALALLSARAAAAPGAASVYYFDHDYRLSANLSKAIEEITSSSGSLKLNRTENSITYTNGAKFVIEGPENLTAEELSRTTDYADEGGVEAVEGGQSIILMPQDLLDTFTPVLEDALSGYFNVERTPARLLAGTSPSGIKFRALYFSARSEKPLWEPTLEMRHYAFDKGREVLFTEVSVPLGLNGLSRKMLEEAADKKGAVLLSLGMGGALAGQILNAGPEKTLGFLSAAGTDIAAIDPDDLNNFWRWSTEGGIKTSSSTPEFICSNVAVGDPKLARLIKPYALRSIGGATVAFISFLPANSATLADLEGSPFSVRDPRDEKALYALINELRGAKKAKAVIAVATNLQRDELGWLMNARGIDAMIGPKNWDSESGRRTRVELHNWDKEAHTGPAITISPDSNGAGLMRMEFGKRQGLTALEDLPAPDDGREPFYYREQLYMKERIVRHFLGSGDTLLPSQRSLAGRTAGPDYGVPDFYDLAAGLIRKKFKAEISIIKVKPFSSNMPGDIPTAMVKTWLGPDKPMVLALAPGRFISELRAKQVPERSPDGYYSPEAYSGGDYYALSGMDKDGRVAGLPLDNAGFYLVAMPADVAEGRNFLKMRKPPPGAPVTLYDTVVGALSEIRSRAVSREAWEARIRDEERNVPAPRNLWFINLRNLSMQMVNTEVSGPAGYSAINEARLSAVNQTQMQGSGRLYSEYYSGKFRFDAGVAADYGKTVLRPRGQPRLTTESIDQLTYETQLVYRMKNYDGKLGRLVMGPYASTTYDTEFSHQDSLPLKKVLRGSGGFKLFEGTVLQDLYAGLSTEQVYTYSPQRTQYSLETGFRLSTPLKGTALVLNADGNYRNFARSRFDTVSDLKQRLELNVKVSTRLYGDVMISPYINYLLVQGKKLPGSASNLTVGFSLEYCRLFKLKR